MQLHSLWPEVALPNCLQLQVKEEPISPQHLVQMPPSPDDNIDIWELLLCGTDVKPNVKVSGQPKVTYTVCMYISS